MAASLWPTSSKSLVASLPAASISTSEPPGCCDKYNFIQISRLVRWKFNVLGNNFAEKKAATNLTQKFANIVDFVMDNNPQIFLGIVLFDLSKGKLFWCGHFMLMKIILKMLSLGKF